MAVRTQSGAAARVLTATVARRYYLDGQSKIDIADEFGLSRFKVARLIDVARASGMVRIQLDAYGTVDVELSSRLQAAWGLRHCVVVGDEAEPAALRRSLGRATGEMLVDIVEPADVLGLAWARSLMSMRSHLAGLAPCTVVQMTGVMSRGDTDDSSIDLVRDVARAGNGPAYFFYAPLILPDAATTQSLRTQPEVARAMSHLGSITKAAVGVGLWEPQQSTIVDAVSREDWRDMYDLGVRAEVCAVQLDAEGRCVQTGLTERTIGIHAEQLRAIPEVIAVAYDAVKAPAVRAVIAGGFAQALVTHTSLATALLAMA